MKLNYIDPETKYAPHPSRSKGVALDMSPTLITAISRNAVIPGRHTWTAFSCVNRTYTVSTFIFQ